MSKQPTITKDVTNTLTREDMTLPFVSVIADVQYWEWLLGEMSQHLKKDHLVQQMKEGCREAIKAKFPNIFE